MPTKNNPWEMPKEAHKRFTNTLSFLAELSDIGNHHGLLPYVEIDKEINNESDNDGSYLELINVIEPTQDHEINNKILINKVVRLLNRLSYRHKYCLIMNCAYDVPNRDIGKRLKISGSRAHQLRNEAIQIIRQHLEEEE